MIKVDQNPEQTEKVMWDFYQTIQKRCCKILNKQQWNLSKTKVMSEDNIDRYRECRTICLLVTLGRQI